MAVTLDVDYCRSHFPNLANGWVYMENAGGSYLPQAVIDKTITFMTECRNQPLAHFASGAQAKDCLESGQQGMADMLGVSQSQLVFGANTTVNFYVLAQALRAKMVDGDEVIVTNQDHEANIGCWRRLGQYGITLKEWQVDPATGLLNIDDLRSLITPRTQAICFTHASNIVAATNDVAAIAKLAHEHGAVVCVDGVAYCPHAALHLKEWDVDFYGFSLYKMYGPHLGVMYCRDGMEERIGNQNHFFLEGVMPAMLNPGGRLYSSVASMAGICEYIDAVYRHHYGDAGDCSPRERYCKVFDLFGEQEEKLSGSVIEFLQSKPRVRILGPATGDRRVRMPTIAFVVDGIKPIEVIKAVSESKVAMGGGYHFYSAHLTEALSLADGVARVSLVHYNTMEDVKRFCQALDPLVS